MRKYTVPSGKDVKRLLQGFEYRHMKVLSRLSQVPMSTLSDIRDHEGAPNPGVDTVRKFLPHLERAGRS